MKWSADRTSKLDPGEVLVEMTRQEFASAIARVITLAELYYVNGVFGLGGDRQPTLVEIPKEDWERIKDAINKRI